MINEYCAPVFRTLIDPAGSSSSPSSSTTVVSAELDALGDLEVAEVEAEVEGLCGCTTAAEVVGAEAAAAEVVGAEATALGVSAAGRLGVGEGVGEDNGAIAGAVGIAQTLPLACVIPLRHV